VNSQIFFLGERNENYALVARLMRSAGYDLVFAESTRVLASAADNRRPLLILFDHDIQEGAVPAISHIRDNPQVATVPVVVIAPAAGRDRLLALGCDGVLVAPLQPTQLVKQLSSFLRGRREHLRVAVRSKELEAFGREMVGALENKVEELSLVNKQLLRSNELKNRALKNIFHELAAPITPLVANLARLEAGQLGPMPLRQRRVLDAVHRDLRSLSSTVGRVLDLAAIDDSQEMALPVACDLVMICREAKKSLESKAHSRRVQIELSLPSSQLMISTQPELISQALLHSLDHAVAFTPRGGVCHLELSLKESCAEIRVLDDGTLLEPAEAASLFEPFTGAGRRDGDGHPALALGLALTDRLSRALGIRLSVESPPSRQAISDHHFSGLCLRFQIPLAWSPRERQEDGAP